MCPNNGYFDTVFAADGDVAAIPDASQGNGTVSYTDGFGILYSTAVASGGYNFPRAQFNQLMKDLTTAIQAYQQFTTANWISSAMNGGSPFSYSKYAQVLYTDGHIYESLQNSNIVTPVNDGVNWKIVDGSVGTNSVVGSARNAKMAVASASPSATFTADQIIVQNSLSGIGYNLSSYSETVNLATNGAGGMDTGSAPASGYVALYAIYDPSTATASILATNASSAAVPNIYDGGHMPSGYTASALISVWATNSSSQFKTGLQIDRTVNFTAIEVLSTSTQESSPTSLSIAAAAPFNAREVGGYANIASSVSSSLNTSIYGDVNGSGEQVVTVTGSSVTGTYSVPVNTSQTIFWSGIVGSGTMTLGIYISSYVI